MCTNYKIELITVALRDIIIGVYIDVVRHYILAYIVNRASTILNQHWLAFIYTLIVCMPCMGTLII